MKTHVLLTSALAALALFTISREAQAQTFTTLTIDSATNTGQHTSMAIINGNPAIAYYDATTLDLKYMRATNAAGTTWGLPVTVDATGDSGTFCSLAVVNGRPAISYHYSGGAGSDNLMYVRAADADGAAWGAPVATYVAGKTGEYTCLRVVNGRPAIAFHDASDKALEYVRADDADGTAWSTLPLDLDVPGGAGAGHFASMAIVGGNPAISYYNQAGKELRYIRATNADGTAWGAPKIVDAPGGGGAGQYTSLAVVNGQPAISYHHAAGDLHYIRALDATGATWPGAGTPVDATSADSGHFTSLAVIGGVPAISYYDVTNQDLHYVVSNDANGTTWKAPVDVDTIGDKGQYTSLIAIGTSPAISYYNVSTGDLKYAYVSSGPHPVSTALGDVVTGNAAPNAVGTVSIGTYDALRRGGYLAENGNLVFPSYLLGGPPAISGVWRDNGTGVKLLALSGTGAVETGAPAANYDVLPQTPAINDSGEVTFLGALTVGTGSPVTTVDNDTALWSELGSTGLGILLREGDAVPGLGGPQIGAFASGCFATAHTGASTGEAAFAVTLKNGTTDTAILRASITGPAVTTVGVVARENTAMPGVAGEVFGSLAGNYSDAIRMDATGNLCFVALSKFTNRESLWYQPAAGGVPVKAFIGGTSATGDAAPGTTGPATFKNIRSPSIGSGGVICFRGMLNNDGDNATGLKNDGIWRGTIAGGFTCILRRGDDNTNRAGLGLPAGAKVGNVWHSWLTNLNHGAWRGWIDVNGNGISSVADGDANAIYTDLSGTMTYVLKVGDPAPNISGATFVSFGLPVVGGAEQYAILGNVTGGTTTAANNWGIWRSAPGGGALSLVLRTGDLMTTTQGVKTILKVDFPDSGVTDRRWEQPVMDATGQLIVFVTYTDGATAQVLVP